MATRHQALRAAGPLTLVLCTSGCLPALLPQREPDFRIVLPGSYEASPSAPVGSTSVPAAPGPVGEASGSAAPAGLARRCWNEVFTSPQLAALVAESLAHNQELDIRIQELVMARAEVAARRGEYQPKVKGRLGAGGDKVSSWSSQGVSDEAHELPPWLWDLSPVLAGSWEVDIWNRLRTEADAAQTRYLASVEGRNFVVTRLVAEIARSYYDLLALDNKVKVLEHNLEIQTRALDLIRIEKQAAKVTELAVQRFEAEIAKNRGHLFELEQDRIEVENRLNFLAGRSPRPVARESGDLDVSLARGLDAGLPADLLDNRPDVRQATRELEAARLDVKAARAAFQPSLSIDAKAGLSTFNPLHLLDLPGSMALGAAGSLVAPLINRAALEAQYRTADARQIQAIYQYEQTLLQAWIEVMNHLAGIRNTRAAYDLSAIQCDRLRNSVALSTILFKAARADYVEVLLTQRDLLEAEMERTDRRRVQQQAFVNLYEALGGGWRGVSLSDGSAGTP